MNRTLKSIVPALLLLAWASEASAAEVDPLDELYVVDDAMLAKQRGGFTWQGMQISFGADLRTYLNGELALETTVSWTPNGAMRSESVSGSLTQAAADQLVAGILSSGRISMNVGTARVYLGNDGQTALVHRTDGGIQNILVNTASHVDVRQQVDATLDLNGYSGFAQRNSIERMSTALGDAVGNAAIGSIGH